MASEKNGASTRGGFTLLELLVVMLIVIVTIALLYPVMSSVRERGRQALCLSHVSQHARAVLMYAQDYDERLPMAWNRTVANTPEDEAQYPHWWNVLQPYVRDKGVFQCPDDGGYLGMRPGDPNNKEPFYPEFGSSYHSLLGWLPPSDPSSSTLPRQPGGLGGLSLASLVDPSRTLLSYDSWPYWHGLLDDDDPDNDGTHLNVSYMDGAARRSRSRTVVAYLANGPDDGLRNVALGDLPQIDPASTPDVKSAGGGSARPARTNAKSRTRVATGPRGKKGRTSGSPKSRTSGDEEARTASESKPTAANPKSRSFGRD